MKRILLVMFLFAFLLSAGIGNKQTMTVKAAPEVCGECNVAAWEAYDQVFDICGGGAECVTYANEARCRYALDNCSQCLDEVVFACNIH